MHDLRDELRDAGVPEPNRADRRKAEALERMSGAAIPKAVLEEARRRGEAAHREVEAEIEGGATVEEAVVRVVERTSKGVRTIRCGGPRPKS